MLEVGQVFDRALVDKLAAQGQVDAFGEHGEFHTRVAFESGAAVEGPLRKG